MNALTTVNGNVIPHPEEVRTPAEDAFTDAIAALSKLYTLASDAGIKSLKWRAENATRELVGWHHEARRPEPLDSEPCRIIRDHTLVNFPPQEEATK